VNPNLASLPAYIGLQRFAKIKEGDTAFVSGAAGVIGTQVGQTAKLKSAGRVIGSAGSDEKVELLIEEYGYDGVQLQVRL